MSTKATTGEWAPFFAVPNVVCHATLLSTEKILCLGRRDNPTSTDLASLNNQNNQPFLLDLSSSPPSSTPTPYPQWSSPAKNVNLFCSGHCIQPDGKVFVIGGHIQDGEGARSACVYTPDGGAGKWEAKDPPNQGRWYPSAITLPNSSIFTISGSVDSAWHQNQIPQIWGNGAWAIASSLPQSGPQALYPRLHLAPDGTVFQAGSLAQSQVFVYDAPPANPPAKTADGSLIQGGWKDPKALPSRSTGERQYGSSAVYDSGKIIWTGGGNEPISDGKGGILHDNNGNQTGPPTNITETIDLSDKKLEWKPSGNMQRRRRHHNATTLPDGSVLVTGGTKGPLFNNLEPGQPVHAAEIWDPSTGKWTLLAEEQFDRCYHGVALLLPNGKVLSSGGGEYGDVLNQPPLLNAQIFSPPYLFKNNDLAPRPTVSGITDKSPFKHGQEFEITVTSNGPISKVTWIRLGSVTHAMNMNQAVVIQKFNPPQASKLTVKVPTNPGFVPKSSAGTPAFAPPGHYMLFVVNSQGVPSEAPIVRIDVDPNAQKTSSSTTSSTPTPSTVSSRTVAPPAALMRQHATTVPELDAKIIAEQQKPAVTVGITPVCPYGLGPCWGGAAEGLEAISDVDVVRPKPDHEKSLAFVYLKDDILPDFDVWRREFAQTANGSYGMRGIEMTLSGVVRKSGGKFVLAGTGTRADVVLAPFTEESNIDWDITTRSVMPVSNDETGAFERLAEALGENTTAEVTGRLHRNRENGFSLDVRDFKLLDGAS